MRIYCKKFKDSIGRERSFVKIDVEDGEELTFEQAALMILNQIDDRLFDIAQNIEIHS